MEQTRLEFTVSHLQILLSKAILGRVVAVLDRALNLVGLYLIDPILVSDNDACLEGSTKLVLLHCQDEEDLSNGFRCCLGSIAAGCSSFQHLSYSSAIS